MSNLRGGRTKCSGVNFTNVLQAAFTRKDPKSAIKLLYLTVYFALLGSGCIKAARKMLMKLTLGCTFGEKKEFFFEIYLGSNSGKGRNEQRSGTAVLRPRISSTSFSSAISS